MFRILGLAVVSAGMLVGCSAPSGGGLAAAQGTASPQAARMTVGDLTSKGGKRLAASEMKALLAGATLKGSTQHGNWTSTQKADGKYSGQFSRYQGGTRNFHGDWYVDDSGRNCAVDKTRPNQSPVCTYYYELDGRYFATEAANPDVGTVLEDRIVMK